MKRINYALLYLKRNIKTTALISLVFFVLINLILIAAILSDLTLFAKDKTIEGIDYSASIDSELCNGKYLSYDKDIHQNINGLKDDLDDLKSEDVQVSYHIITNAYSTELFFPDDGVSDLNYNEQRFFGIDEADLSKIASINDLSDDEVIVPAGYHYEDGTMVQIGDELTYDLPIFTMTIIILKISSPRIRSVLKLPVFMRPMMKMQLKSGYMSPTIPLWHIMIVYINCARTILIRWTP